MKKYVSGAYAITLGIFVSRLIGIFFVFPFSAMVKEEGLSLYSYAYVPYTLFIDIATLGIPLGLSKLVAKYDSENNVEASLKVLKVSSIIMILIGIIGFIGLNLFSTQYAYMVLGGRDSLVNKYDDVVSVIRAISFAILFIPLISALRGFLQGKQRMWPTAISQIVEQVVRVSIILISSYIIIYVEKKSYVMAITWAMYAATFGALSALIVLAIFGAKDFFKERASFYPKNKVTFEIFRYALPYAFIGINFALYQFIDSLVYNKGLLDYGIQNPEVYYGVYAFEVQKLIFIPIALAIGFSTSILPAITEKPNEAEKIGNNGINLVLFWIIPISIFTFLFSKQVYALFYSQYDIGERILFFYSFFIPIYSLNNVCVSILQGINKHYKLLIALFIGVIIKASVNYLFISKIGPIGGILASLLGYSVTLLINIYILRRYLINLNYLLIGKMILKALICLIPTLSFGLIWQNIDTNRLSVFFYLVVHSLIFFITYFILNRKSMNLKSIKR